MLGGCCVKSWSSTQALISLSSAEAEYYGIVKASSVGLGCKAMLKDMGIDVAVRVHTDAEAAKGIASRTGLGKTRHIAVHFLWVQEKVRNGDLSLQKVRGEHNPADLMTKHLSREKMMNFMSTLSLSFEEGRSSSTPVS